MKKRFSRYGSVMLAAVFIILSKAAGAISKIPLTAILGAENAGLYQAAFPLYGFLISLSSGGLTACVSSNVSASNAGKRPLSHATVRFLVFIAAVMAATAAVFSFVTAPFVASLQGAPSVAPVYRVLSPAIAFAGAAAVLRGWLTGNKRFALSASGELLAQCVKAAAGTAGAVVFTKINPAFAPSAAAAGVTLSELACLIYLLFITRKNSGASDGDPCDYRAVRRIIAGSLPLAAGSVLAPLTSFAESFIIFNALKQSLSDSQAAALYGLKEGAVGSLLALPTAVFAALYSYFLPSLSEQTDGADFTVPLGCFTFTALSFSTFYAITSNGIINALYPSLTAESSEKAAFLLATGASTVLFGGISQAFSALLHAHGITWQSMSIKAVASVIKLSVCFLAAPSLGINGAMLAQVMSSAFCAAATLIYATAKLKPTVNLNKFVFPTMIAAVFGICLLIFKPAFAMLSPFLCVALTSVCSAATAGAATTASLLLRKLLPRKSGGGGA